MPIILHFLGSTRVSVLDLYLPQFVETHLSVCPLFYLQVGSPVVQWFSLQEATGGSTAQAALDWAAPVRS